MTRVLLAPDGPRVRELAVALRAAGHDPVIAHGGAAAIDVLLRRRGFADPLSRLPGVAAALLRGRFDVVHAFAAPEAALALALRRAPVVFTCMQMLDRASVANGRLRLGALRRAVEGSDAVLVPGDAEREALRRWMAHEARVLDPRDVAAHAQLYGELEGRA